MPVGHQRDGAGVGTADGNGDGAGVDGTGVTVGNGDGIGVGSGVGAVVPAVIAVMPTEASDVRFARLARDAIAASSEPSTTVEVRSVASELAYAAVSETGTSWLSALMIKLIVAAFVAFVPSRRRRTPPATPGGGDVHPPVATSSCPTDASTSDTASLMTCASASPKVAQPMPVSPISTFTLITQSSDGTDVGTVDGEELGDADGGVDGAELGMEVGSCVGRPVGNGVGRPVGNGVGTLETVGVKVGCA